MMMMLMIMFLLLLLVAVDDNDDDVDDYVPVAAVDVAVDDVIQQNQWIKISLPK
jgi:hypothetical protein